MSGLITEFFGSALCSFVYHNESAIAERMRRKIFRTTCYIDTAVMITNYRNFEGGNSCALYHGTYILNTNGKLILGENSHLGAMCYVNVCYGNVTIGDNVAIGPHTMIIAYSNHYESGKKTTDVRIIKDILVGSNVFLGANCTILPGSIIESDVVVGAGSVVRGRLESNGIYAGIPCKKIRYLSTSHDK